MGPDWKKPANEKGSNKLKVNNFDTSNRAEIDKTVERGKQVKAFRKAIQKEYELGIEKRQRQQLPPSVSVARASKLLEDNVQDTELKAIFQSALDYDDDDDDDEVSDEDSFIRQQGVLMGAFYIVVRVEVQAWFTGAIAECGFGSSRATMPFNEPRLMQILEMSDMSVEACKLVILLIWAAMDGRITAKKNDNVFEVEVPEDNRPGSIKKMFVKWFVEILEITPAEVSSHVQFSEYEDGKDIANLRIKGKGLLGSLASKILSVVEDYELSYLTHDRLDSLHKMHGWRVVAV
jgi:hypothetical protein